MLGVIVKRERAKAHVRDLWTQTVKGVQGKPKRVKTPQHGKGMRWLAVWFDKGGAEKSKAGHADPGFTLRTYTHLMPASEDRTRKAIDAAFHPKHDHGTEPEQEAL